MNTGRGVTAREATKAISISARESVPRAQQAGLSKSFVPCLLRTMYSASEDSKALEAIVELVDNGYKNITLKRMPMKEGECIPSLVG